VAKMIAAKINESQQNSLARNFDAFSYCYHT